MKMLVFSLGLGCSQFLVDQTCAFVDQSFKKEVDRKMIMVTGLLFVEGAAGLNKFLKTKADKNSICSKGLYQKFHY